ncbi:MAG TPA: MarR family winged helix-turn-helix transcriptional regulator [Mycobacteriales bacterium]|nr:MarR family winged helix-turn-helix transcriptional regulator [Mycobacteriales bacterium]
MARGVTDKNLQDLLRLRTELRRFQRWSEGQAKDAGLTHMQHQLLLAVKGHVDPRGPTIGEAADYLLLRHHSCVELIDRVEALGHIERLADPDDARVARLSLTRSGERCLAKLSSLHIEELRRLKPVLATLIDGLDGHKAPLDGHKARLDGHKAKQDGRR